MAPSKPKHIAEFGDFQTPDALANEVLALLRRLGMSPRSIFEPSCGRGAFLAAAAETFPDAKLFGLDINQSYLSHTAKRLASNARLQLAHESFFEHDWSTHIERADAPLLILGNPPWVTNAELGTLGSANLPAKSNFQNLKGLDAVTGKSNFDISEWMLLQNIEWLCRKPGMLAVLCKTAVARKIVAAAWKRNIPLADARIYRIDALEHFGAAVDACLFVIQIDGINSVLECAIYASLQSRDPERKIGFVDNSLISNVDIYHRYRNLRGVNRSYTWRSGVKHDCSKIMELDRTAYGLVNGLGQTVDIEDTYLFPLMKSSDIAGKRQKSRDKFVIVTQRFVGEDTRHIERDAPRTWRYLEDNRVALDRRTSVIYRNKPSFSMFGVGEYTFAPWKIAISGLYKKLAFQVYGAKHGKPICFDDTVYFLPFDTQEEAQNVLKILNTEEAQGLLESMVFWDEKRPITVDLLKRADIEKIAACLGRTHELPKFTTPYGQRRTKRALQASLF